MSLLEQERIKNAVYSVSFYPLDNICELFIKWGEWKIKY